MKSQFVLLTVDEPEYTYYFHPNNPLVLGSNPEIGLKSYFMWHTQSNISEKFNNNKVKIFYAGQWKTVTIDRGMYEISSLSKFLNEQIEFPEGRSIDSVINEPPPKIQLDVNLATFRCIVRLAPGYKIDFSQGDLYKLLGVQPKIYDQPSEEGPDIINITRNVDNILIRCSLVDRPLQNEFNDVLYDVLPFSEPGSAIFDRIDDPEFYPCKDKIVRHMTIKLTDLDGKEIGLSERVYLKIQFKHVE